MPLNILFNDGRSLRCLDIKCGSSGFVRGKIDGQGYRQIIVRR